MKQTHIFFVLFFIVLLMTTPLFPQIDNLTNMSAEWIRTSNRNAATDAVDIVVYNPAGLTKLSEGLHINLGNQSLFRKPQHNFDLGFGKQTFKQEGTDMFLPNFYAAYRSDNWAIFAGIYIPGGGATINYPNGSITTNLIGYQGLLTPPENGGVMGYYENFYGDYIKATSVYLTSTLGAAYEFNDTFSLGLGFRYINARNTTKAGLTYSHSTVFLPELTLVLDTKQTARGIGLIYSVNLNFQDKLNLALRYESKIRLNFKTKINKNDFGDELAMEGETSRRDFPAMLGIGIGYSISTRLKLEVDFNYFFQKNAKWGRIDETNLEYSHLAGDCWSFGGAILYEANSRWLWSCGFLYTDLGFKDIDNYYNNLGSFEVLYSDNWNIGTGCRYEMSDTIRVNLGLSMTIWKSETITIPPGIDVDTKNSTFTLALGFDFLLE